jgi:hypothetical protein
MLHRCRGMGLTRGGDGFFGSAKPRARCLEIVLDRLRFGLSRRSVPLELDALVGKTGEAGLKLRPLQRTLAELGGKRPLLFPLAIKGGAAARQATTCLDQGGLRLVLSRFCFAIPAGDLFAPLLGLAHRRMEFRNARRWRDLATIVELC